MREYFAKPGDRLMGEQKTAYDQMAIAWDGVEESFMQKFGISALDVSKPNAPKDVSKIQEQCLALFNIIDGLITAMLARAGGEAASQEKLKEVDFRSRQIIQKISQK